MRAQPDRQPSVHGRHLGLWATTLLALVAACGHEPAPSSPFQSPAASAPPPDLVLREQAWDSGEVLERFYYTLASLEGPVAAADLLLEAATGHSDEAFKTSAGARALAIHAIYRCVQARTLGERFERVRTLVDRMYRVSPEAAETRFALVYLRWLLLSDGRGGLRLGDLTRTVAVDLQAQLQVLAAEHPEFDGPGDFDRRRIAAERDAVGRLLADLPAQTTPSQAPLPDPISPTVQPDP